jgi:glycosyltransferase involved in cell wall biosynthesis
MKISVILCTYNRCGSLAKTLSSVAASILPQSVEWEVLVVDNNSTDQTRVVAGEFQKEFQGRFRYLFEPQQGKSFALNKGVREARGDVLAFLDDDVIVEAAWLKNLTSALQTQEWAGAGGRILPLHKPDLPRWLSLEEPYNLGGPLCGLFDLGDSSGELDRAPFGANMAFQKIMFEKYGSFRTDLGPPPGNNIHGEDTEFGQRLIAAGKRLHYEPFAIVYHPVLEDRLKQSYFLAFWFDHGRAAVRVWKTGGNIIGVPRRFFTALKLSGVIVPFRAMLWLLDFNPSRRFYRKCRVWMTAGQIFEVYQRLRETRK